MYSFNPNLSSEIIDQSSDAGTVSMECTTKPGDELNTRVGKDVAFSPGAINQRIEEVQRENSLIVVSAVETDIQKGDNISIDQCPRIESEFHGHYALTNQNQDSMTENLEAGLAGSLDQSSYCLSGSMHIVKENENSVEATAAVSTDPEVFLNRGMPRRCLQFEDVLHNVISNQSADSPTQSRGPKSPLETPLIPIKGKQADTTQNLYPRNMNVKIPKPSGIGLHLNSIVNAVQAGSGAIIHVKSAQRCKVSIRGKKLIPITNSCLDSSNSSSISTTTEDVSASTDVNRHETHTSLAVNSAASLSTNIVNSSNNSILLNPVDDQSTPGNKRMYPYSENDGNSEEFKSSPQKKRKKSSDSSDGCKRCNCKKSKCLKLYCDCFAAGIYCAGPCSCQGCYNRPEYVDTVLETRQQIEIRNPLAFAPKIVQHKIEAPEDGAHSTPSSARHKRGCNCKKSMCLKKYCECYQANVGCSDGCGCEGCKNVYGQKGENGMDKAVLIKEGANERTDSSLSGYGCLIHSELSNSHDLIPLTPEVQFLNHRKDKSKARIHSGQHFQSPESSLTSVIPCMMTPEYCRNSDNNGMISETAGEVLDLLSSNQELCYENAETPLDEFSPVCYQPGKIGDCCGGQNPQEQGNNRYSSMVSLSWRGSPNTPMAQSSASKPLKVIDLDGELFSTTQDLTPDILKDNPTPLNAVKVSSPNKKRVSPPHRPQRELGSSSVEGLRTGRKFILKAVPSFPLLTPSDSQRIRAQQMNDPQNHTSNK